MTGAVFAQGHWRRRDPLDGLNPALLAALEDAYHAPLVRKAALFHSGMRARGHDSRTVAAAGRRGLIKLRCDDDGENPRFLLTVSGLEAVQEIIRRRKGRASLSRSGS